MWNSKVDTTTWPGISIDDNLVSDKAHYAIIDTSIYNNIIFNTSGKQTDDLEIPTYQDLTCIILDYKQSVWRRYIYFGNWHKYYTWINNEYNNWYENDYKVFEASAEAGY